MTVRLLGIDAGRFVAAFCVILIHTAHGISYTIMERPPLALDDHSFRITTGDVITQLCRWAVPFFFISGGYFAWRPGETLIVTAVRLARRVLPVFLVWSIFYNLISPWHFQWFYRPGYIARWLLNGGAGDQLWFLPALLTWVVVARLLKEYASWAISFSIAVALYLVGLIITAGQPLFLVQLNQRLFTLTRDGPSFGLFFVLTGMWLRYSGFTLSLPAALGLFVASAGVQLGEAYLFNSWQMMAFFKSDYLLSTIPFGVSAFLIALKITGPEAVLEKLAMLGRFTLGIYAVHIFFVQYIAAVTGPSTLDGRLIVASAAMVGSVILVLLMARITFLKCLVS